jgi:hypothetical protein
MAKKSSNANKLDVCSCKTASIKRRADLIVLSPISHESSQDIMLGRCCGSTVLQAQQRVALFPASCVILKYLLSSVVVLVCKLL